MPLTLFVTFQSQKVRGNDVHGAAADQVAEVGDVVAQHHQCMEACFLTSAFW